ncbi:MRG/MORF4L-binding protein isoform X1 [Tribolium madens]|uniref:MRG/MORF4L-binding protein isoform X1 n=2 Tax=Tribolium madens TaxID=41895 RepID=UPI001CF7390A|nr:MRG/MORF4L-binding protein isoform X1 [Tribolium madens]
MDEIEWNVAHEGQLLEAMVGHKPVGVNKYFQMACICDKFADSCQKEINSAKVWAHLETMYNLEALDESESIPFPNSEREFALPDSDFGSLLVKKEDDKKLTQKGRETPKSLKELRKEEKTPIRNIKEVQRRDSKDSKEKTPASAKKEMKKEPEKSKSKGKSNSSTPREENKTKKSDDTPKLTKRPTRGSSKPDDSSSSGKSSPIAVTPPATKRRRI